MTRVLTHALNIALLRRREIVIEQDHVRGNRGGRSRNFFQLAFADQRSRIRTVVTLRKLAGDLGARAGSQGPQFVKRFFGAEVGTNRRR